VNILNYLGLIYDKKLTFKEHINYTAKNTTKLIFSLSNAPKLNWCLNHKALNGYIYIVGILPVLAYSRVWAKSTKIESYELKLIKEQKILNIKWQRLTSLYQM